MLRRGDRSDPSGQAYTFTVRTRASHGPPPPEAKNGTKLARGANFRCVLSGAPIPGDYIKAEGRAGRMGARLMAIVAEGERGRVYLPPTPEHEAIARQAQPPWKPEVEFFQQALGFRVGNYGMTKWSDLFTPRQLVALTTFADLVGEAMAKVRADYLGAQASPLGAQASPLGAQAFRPQPNSLGARASRPQPSPPHAHRGWHSRGYHPHFDRPGLVQSVTFRLHDSVPESLLQRWRDELGIAAGVAADDERMAKLRRLLDQYEDAGHGACHLRSPEIAELVESALLHFDGERYRLLEWCIMPNHVHALVEIWEGHPLDKVVHAWKSFTAKEANRRLQRDGPFWMADYYDRFIRDEKHLETVRRYIRENPVKAGLCDSSESWPWSSAAKGKRFAGETSVGTRASGPQEDSAGETSVGTRASGPQEDSAGETSAHPIAGETSAHPIAGGTPAHPIAGETSAHPIAGGTSAHPIAGGTPAHPGDDDKPLRDGGAGPTAYAQAVGVYLGLAVSRATDAWSSQVSWRNSVEATRGTFARQALPMVWDFTEANPFSASCGNWDGACLLWVNEALEALPHSKVGAACQQDAGAQILSLGKLVSTDPPYYDNVGYADLSDFFYVWLRRSLRSVFPDLFATLAVPKAEELVATPYRHGSKEAAERFFLEGMTRAMHRLAEQAHPAFPVTIYYAFKQQEVREETREKSDSLDPDSHSSLLFTHSSTGWETFLDAVLRAGFAISGTWPMRTERGARSTAIDTNALASSIVLVCRPRSADAPTATRREFMAALKAELPAALAELQKANIAPVDLAQAAIGPGMAVYTRYAQVLDAQGRPVGVREALALINQTLDEVLAEQEGDFDADSRWALAWFEQQGFGEGEFGVAETLSKAKNTSIEGLVQAGILASKRGKVRLLRPGELPADWDPATDARLTVWEMVHHLVRVLEAGGEQAAAALLARLGGRADVARELCYRLYTSCERKKRAAEALSYNALVQAWPELARLAQGEAARKGPEQGEML